MCNLCYIFFVWDWDDGELYVFVVCVMCVCDDGCCDDV